MKKEIKGLLVLLLLSGLFGSSGIRPAEAAETGKPSYNVGTNISIKGLGGELHYLGSRPDGVFYLGTSGNGTRNSQGNRLRNYVLAVNPNTSKVLWKHAVYGSFGFQLKNSFVMEDGRIYGAIGFNPRPMSSGTKFYALNAAGKQEWEVVVNEFAYLHGFVNGKLLVYSSDAAYAIDKQGKIIWTKKVPASSGAEYKVIQHLYDGGYVLSSSSGRYHLAEITDWNMKTQVRYVIPENSRLLKVKPFGKDLYIAHIELSNKKQLLVAIDAKSQVKWTRSVDPTTGDFSILDGKLMFANNTGFYVLDNKGTTVRHIKVDLLPNVYSYELEADKDRIVLRSSILSYPLDSYLRVYDRKTFVLLETLDNPSLRIQDPASKESESGSYYEALFYVGHQLYASIDGSLKKLNPIKE
ncbi:PQQ-binding-like beta-propeller repeat protein [Paenibacillus polysaccharolyticus]|uniref:outer membrane protein assembly factor BamB family protein n=1 Tax=Paenibacillus polysaccharolyticus TaxID=582692 RepID=UPI002040CE53|nr:PQQ-binding-like beta-propeller repeat protein [Paenibacillus polysaccharolyticus]MCM3133147.1 PQQ-binding-like beta-propeller repeat protein [Paenibacillus polysaccharolyticus]